MEQLLTKKQIRLASKAFDLAFLALADTGGAETENEENVLQFSIDKAKKDFFKLFPNESTIPNTLHKCIELAKKF